MEFHSFEEFWAALDKLDIAIAQMLELQRQTAERLAAKANPGPKSSADINQQLDQLGATLAALGVRIAQLTETNTANELRLLNGTA